MNKLLLVDDEPRMLQLLKLYLEPHGFICLTAGNGKEALKILDDQDINLVLLDVMMPEMDGWETVREIRYFSEVPIIMLTARDQSHDIVKGLKSGADDYITKPFDEEVLVARIESVLRRKHGTNLIESNGLIWDGSRYELSFSGKSIILTPKEFEMVGLLLKNKDTVLTREKLIERIWGYQSETEERTIDSHVRNIRDKLRKVGFPVDEHLKTIWGIGYKWNTDKTS